MITLLALESFRERKSVYDGSQEKMKMDLHLNQNEFVHHSSTTERPQVEYGSKEGTIRHV